MQPQLHHAFFTLTDHVKEIISFALSRGITFNNTEILFCGGGSLILHLFPEATISDDPQYGNVKSYLMVGEAKWLNSSYQ